MRLALAAEEVQKAQIGDGAIAVALIAFFAVLTLAFRVVYMFSRSKGHPVAGAFGGAVIGFLAGFAAMLGTVLIADGEFGAFVAVFLFGLGLFVGLRKMHEATSTQPGSRESKAIAEAAAQPRQADPARPLHWSERPLDEDWKRDAGAREEQRYSPTLVYPMSATAVKSNRERRSADERKESRRTRKPRRDAVIDVIRFDYEDRNGDPSAREIEVTAISDEYFEGWCRESQGKRTFRLDRVTGDVVSLETGEIDNPYAWAGEHMDDDRNVGVDDSRWFH